MKIFRLSTPRRAVQKKAIIFVALATYLFTMFLVLTPAHVSAANEQGTWIDNNTINFRGDDYIKRINDGHEGYIHNKDISDLCSSGQDGSSDVKKYGPELAKKTKIRIIRDISGDKSTAHHIVYEVALFFGDKEISVSDVKVSGNKPYYKGTDTPAKYGCKNTEQINIDFISTTAARDAFSWVDKGAIETSDGKRQFLLDGASGNYVWQADNNKCKEKIAVTGGDAGSGQWSHKGELTADGGCKYKVDPIGIARPDNAIIEAGKGQSVNKDQKPTGGDSKIKCSFSANPLTWFMCPLIEGLETIVNKLDREITNFLTVPTDYFDSNKAGSGTNFYLAWASLRSIALVLLVIMGLVMVISQALAVGPFDAYTVKKILPRILIAVIFITLSWAIMGYMVQLSNDLGGAVRGIIEAPFDNGFGNGGINITGAAQTGGAAVLLASGFALGIIGLLSLVATAALAVLVAFAILLFRQILITMLAVLAPIAIIFFVLPNTQKYWKIWWESFSKALLMFPIISAFIAAGRVFAKVATVPNDDLPHQLFAFAAYFAPYFLLPTAFKLAGGALSTISGSINDRSRGAFDRLKKFRQGQTHKNWDKTKAGNRFQGGTANNFRGKLNRGLQTGTLLPQAGLNPGNMKASLAAARSARTSTLMGKAGENEHVQAILKNDDMLNALSNTDGSDGAMKQYLSEVLHQNPNEVNQSMKSISQARKAVGAQNLDALAAVANAGTGTGYKGGPAEMLATINRVAGGDRALASRMLAGARGEAEKSRRGDLYGAGFAASNQEMGAMHTAGAQKSSSAAWQGANERLTDAAVNTKSAGELASGRNNALENLVPALQRRMVKSQAAIQDAENGVFEGKTVTGADKENAIRITQREHKRVLAHTASILDAAGSVSPENAATLGNKVLGKSSGGTVDIKEMRNVVDAEGNAVMDQRTGQQARKSVTVGTRERTYADEIEDLRNDSEFGLFRREYGRASEADAAARAAAGINPATQQPHQ